MASEALEISSRRKISLLLYSECTIRSRIWTTSAWKLKFSGSACVVISKCPSRGNAVSGGADVAWFHEHNRSFGPGEWSAVGDTWTSPAS